MVKLNGIRNIKPLAEGAVSVHFRNNNWSVETLVDDCGELVVYVVSTTHGIIRQVEFDGSDPDFGDRRIPPYIRSKVCALWRVSPSIAA